MEFNRNHYFMFGLVLLLLGVQFRTVESYVLNEKTSHFLNERISAEKGEEGGVRAFLPAMGPAPRRTVRPPAWLGWFLISTGSVLVLQSLAMKKPGAQ